jgi:hypothetical protein
MDALLIWPVIMFGPILAWLLSRSGGYKRRPEEQPSGPGWERTEERFLDPTSGEVLVVWYCARTGELAYVRAV